MENNQTYRLLSCGLEILKMLVEAGAEIYRVEESAVKMLTTYGAKHVDVFAITSHIIISIEMPDGTIKTHTRRISNPTVDIEKIHKLNALMRKICESPTEIAQIEKELAEIRKNKKYPAWLNTLVYGLIAAAFYMFFGGRSVIELISSFGIGLVTGIITLIFSKITLNSFFTKFLCSFTACLISFALKKFSVISSVDYIIIANIMSLIPGIGLTNSLRDLFAGDSISGILRFIEAALLALSIACGYIVTTFIFGGAV